MSTKPIQLWALHANSPSTALSEKYSELLNLALLQQGRALMLHPSMLYSLPAGKTLSRISSIIRAPKFVKCNKFADKALRGMSRHGRKGRASVRQNEAGIYVLKGTSRSKHVDA
ncbi:hypothetical protein DFH09DRAFT_1089699 [Mycena vulgaris]|nr:hypothetical protein DFH09DRAFT_1089699 [Mycena vulgaris]